MTLETGTPATPPANADTGSGTEASRNAADDAARDGRSDGEDDLESVDDPTRLREMLREMRKGERKRNEGYNSLREQHRVTTERLAAIERERSQSAPVEERVESLESQLAEKDKQITRMEQERKDERTDAAIMSAATRLNAADPGDVVRLLDRDDLQVSEDGTPSNAEVVVRNLLEKKPHLLRSSGGGGADGGSRGSSGKGDSTDMNAILRGSRRSRTMEANRE